MQGTKSTSESITVTVPSASQPDIWYTLTLFADGIVSCSCKGYHYRGNCRHVREEADRATRWNSRTCTQCGASGPVTAVTQYVGGHGYVTTHACRSAAACGARRQVAA